MTYDRLLVYRSHFIKWVVFFQFNMPIYDYVSHPCSVYHKVWTIHTILLYAKYAFYLRKVSAAVTSRGLWDEAQHQRTCLACRDYGFKPQSWHQGKREGKDSEWKDCSVYTTEGFHVLLLFYFREFKAKNLSKIWRFRKAVCKGLRSKWSWRLIVLPWSSINTFGHFSFWRELFQNILRSPWYFLHAVLASALANPVLLDCLEN